MILPTFFKRRTSRRTSKRRQTLSTSKPNYDSLEKRNLLATFVVNTTADVVDAEDGLISLREAVSAANSNAAFSDAGAGDVDGDRIVFESDLVFARYTLTEGELTVTDDLVVRGNGIGNGGTSIHGASRSRIFNVDTTERVQFRNLHLVGGVTEGSGGLLNLNESSDVVIRGAQLSSGVASDGFGGAINAVDSRLFVRDTQINNSSAQDGGAIYAVDSDVRIVASFFFNNHAADSGGAIHATGGKLGVYNSSFGTSAFANVASDYGGAVYVAGTSDAEAILVSSSSFTNNEAELGGAIFAGENTSAFIVSGSFFENGSETTAPNASTSFGGAIFSEGNGLYITGATFSENQAALGAAIYSAADYSNFNGLNVSGNESSASGGGIVFQGIEAFISDSTVDGNVSGEVAGGIAVSGGSKAVLRRVTVAGNSAEEGGGGIWASPGSILRVFGSTVADNVAGDLGGGITSFESDLVITGSTVSGNRVEGDFSAGGGIAAINGSTLVFDSLISDNESEENGGGLLVRGGYARLEDTNVVSNTANSAFSSVGGGIDLRSSSTLVLVGGEVSFNATSGPEIIGSRAGAVNVDSDARMFVRSGTRFESNTAESLGGAIQVAGFLSVQDATFTSNSATSGGAIFLTRNCLLYTSPSPRDKRQSRMPSSA